MKLGADVGLNLAGPVIKAAPGLGTHGYLPDRPEMRASLSIMGRGIVAGRDLGVVDMRQVAPIIATILGVKLPSASAEKLRVLL
jgi:hypothetical protein